MTQYLNTTGIFPWFPESGSSLVHPDDLQSFAEVSPAAKVFQVVDEREGFLTLRYGARTFRVKPDLYRPVMGVAFRIGDVVNVEGAQPRKSGVIRDVHWHFKNDEPIYSLSFNGKPSSRRYSPQELSPSEPTDRLEGA